MKLHFSSLEHLTFPYIDSLFVCFSDFKTNFVGSIFFWLFWYLFVHLNPANSIDFFSF